MVRACRWSVWEANLTHPTAAIANPFLDVQLEATFKLTGTLLDEPAAPPQVIPPPSETPGDCGLSGSEVPDFQLMDLNPNSSTHTQTYTLDTFQAEVLVIYWALAS